MDDKITKTDMISYICKYMNENGYAEDRRITVQATKIYFDGIFEALRQMIIDGSNINILNFGTFVVENVPEKKMYNCIDKEEQTVPQHRRVKFKVARSFREQVYNGIDA